MKLKGADLFCGAGGTSEGARQTGEVDIVFGINHWDVAIQTHSANFPNSRHVNSRLEDCSPSESPKMDLLFASPSCTHHSRARGGKPTSDQQRSHANDVLKWLEHHRPSWFVLENVREFLDWGPVGDDGRPLKKFKGKLFDAWLMSVKGCGYTVDYRILNAADFGAATSRDRLFVVARKGNRRPVFPEPTHSEMAGGELPGMGLPRWRAAAEVIDWSIECPSIFSRKRPLADKTLARIEAGMRRFVGPFVTVLRNNQHSNSTAAPLGTICTSGAHHGIAVPFQYQLIGRGAGRARDVADPVPTMVATRENHGIAVPYMVPFFGERDGQVPRFHGVGEALPCVTSHGAGGLAVPFVMPPDGFYDPHTLKRCRGSDEPLSTITAGRGAGAVVCPFVIGQQSGAVARELDNPLPTIATGGAISLSVPYLMDVNHGHDGSGRTSDVANPLGTITAKRGKGLAVPFLSTFYGNGGCSRIDCPLPTLTTKDRVSLSLCSVCGIPPAAAQLENPSPAMLSLLATMAELGVADIGFRMLQNHELAAAQGFGPDYIFCGNKSDVTRQIGNSVSPDVAREITKGILAV